MEIFIYVIFFIFGLVAVISVIVALKKIVGGASSWTLDGETERLCKTLDGDELYKLAQGLVNEKGYKTDYTKWEKYTFAAANKGCVPAQRDLGKHYKYENNKLAIDWLQRAADGGDSEAAVILGEIYQYGMDRGTPKIAKDIDKAIEVFTSYAEKGDVSALKKLAYCYRFYKDDNDTAVEWYLKAAEKGDPEAMHEIWQTYLFNNEEEKGLEWLQKAADTGFAEAECSLGNHYSDLDEPDFKSAAEWYEKSANHGYSFAMCRLGEMYLAGEGVLKDAAKAYEWFEKAMDAGSVYGEFLVGRCYMQGDGVAQDIEKGIRHYTEAAKYDGDAQYALAECYLSGNGVKKDFKKAVDLLLQAEEDDFDGKVTYKLGELYYSGEGVKKDEQKAREFWLKSARHGDKDAAESLKIYFGETVDKDE